MSSPEEIPADPEFDGEANNVETGVPVVGQLSEIDDAQFRAAVSAVNESKATPYLKLASAFLDAQRQILRLAGYVSEREKEIDDPRAMALAAVQRTHAGASPEHFDSVWGKVQGFMSSFGGEDGKGITERTAPDATELQEVVAALFRETPQGLGPTYILGMMQAVASQPNSPRLLSSLLTAMVSDFEVLVAGLARLVIAEHPGILASADRKYEWKEISEFDTLEAFRQNVVDRAVDKLLFESFSEWMDFFASKCHFRVPAISSGFELLEVFQRRHVIIHNGGLVSRQYIEKLRKHGETEQLGSQLTVDQDYLLKAADALCILGTCLVANAADKFLGSAEDKRLIERAMGNYPYELIQDGRYVAAFGIACEQDLGEYSNDYTALVVRINRWLALKRMGRLGECRDEIMAWQTDSLAEEFQLARLALLDEFELAYEIVQRIRGTRSLSFEFWIQWPLLEELRAYEFGLSKPENLDTETSDIVV